MDKRFLLLIQLATGLVWLKSVIPKFTDSAFVTNMPKTLTYFASKNPFPWYKQFLETSAIPNSFTYAQLSRWGELTTAVLLIITAVMIFRSNLKIIHLGALVGLGIGGFLNLNFGFASFWTSPANETVNLYMFVVQFILLIYHLQTKTRKIQTV